MAEQLLLFSVDGLSLAVPVDRVEEVLRRHPSTAVPLAPPWVGGLVNLRGALVLAVDLRVRLGRPPAAEPVVPMHIVVRTAAGPFSLLCDRIDDVHEVESARRTPVPERLNAEVQALARGVHPFPDRLVLELDVDRLTEASP